MKRPDQNLLRPPFPISRGAAALLGPLLLTGCMLGPDYQRPETPLPAHYTEPQASQGGDAALQRADWWALFGDTTLNGLVDQALKSASDVRIAIARVEESEAVLRQTGAAQLPEIDLTANPTRSRISSTTATPLPSSVSAIRNDFRATLGTSFELDFWGRLRRATEAARDQAMASQYALDTTRITLAGLVTQNYINLRSADAQIAVSEQTLTSRDASLRIAQRRFTEGLASQLDVQQATTAHATIVAQIAELRRQRSLAEHQIGLLTGAPGLTVAPGDLRSLPVPPQPPAGLPSSLLDARPDLRQAEAQLAAANAQIGIVKAAMFPTLSLTGNFGAESQSLSNLLRSNSGIWSFGLGLSLPVFDAGRNAARVDQATAQQKQALESYRKAVQTAFTEVSDALSNGQRLREGEQAQETQTVAARRTLELAEKRYAAGYSAYLEVLDAQRTYNDAMLASIRQRQSRLNASVDLIKALGGGWQDKAVPHS